MNKADIQDIYPLTPTQQGMMLHSLAQTHAAMYLVQVRFKIDGPLDATASKRAWQDVVKRHDVLRSAFILPEKAWQKNTNPMQVVAKQATLNIVQDDWSQQDQASQQDQLNALLEQQREDFALNKAPLMRVAEIALAPLQHQFVISFHHLILDGWSLPIIMRDWAAFYADYVCAEQAELASSTPKLASLLPQAIPFRDYIAKLKQHQVEQSASSAAYWQQLLGQFDSPNHLGIAPVSTSAAVPSTRSAGVSEIAFDQAQSEALLAFAKTARVTPNHLIQAAWGLVLNRVSAQSEAVFGVTNSGRPYWLAQADQRVGMFINTTAFKVDDKPNASALEYVQYVSQQAIEQQTHELSSALSVAEHSAVSAGSSLYESIIVFENYPIEGALGDKAKHPVLSALNLHSVEVQEKTNFPLSLFVFTQSPVRIRALFEQQRYQQSDIDKLMQALECVLMQFINTPDIKLADLSLLNPEQTEHSKAFFNQTQCDSNTHSVLERIAIQAQNQPDAIALRFKDQQLTYRELDQISDNIAHNLLAQLSLHSHTEQAAVGLCLERSAELVLALLGIFKAGAYYVPLDPKYPEQRLSYFCQDSGLDYIVCDQHTQSLAQSLLGEQPAQALLVDDLLMPSSTPQNHAPLPGIRADQLAYTIYTSGSTGKPKGVAIEHHSLNNLLNAFATRLEAGPKDKLLSVTTISFDIVGLELLLPLISGGCLSVACEQSCKNPEQLLALMAEHDINLMQATPATWRMLLRFGWSGQADLRILCGGEALDASLASQLLRQNRSLWNVYGPTETTIWSSALELQAHHIQSGNVPIGPALDNTGFYVLDQQQHLLAAGIEGELYISGDGLARGYHQQAELTQERFIWHQGLNKRLYRTGDKVRYRQDGSLDFLGRIDFQAKLRGYRIELAEIEHVLAADPSVEQVVVDIYGEGDAQRLRAYIRSANSQTHADETVQQLERDLLLEKRLQALAAKALPSFMVPSEYLLLNRLPLTLNAKVDRLALKAMDSSAQTSAQTGTQGASCTTLHNQANVLKPGNEIERQLVAIWQQLLGRDDIGIDDSFFEIGGNSLLLMSMKNAIKDQLQREIALTDLFRFPSIRSLANFIQQAAEPVSDTSATATPDTTTDTTPEKPQRAQGRHRLAQKRQRRKA